jgi:16S rRNA processing protein RimM
LANKGEFILVGRLGRTRGVWGWLWITPDTDFPDRFLGLKRILVSEHDTWSEFEIEEAQIISGRPMIKFVGIDSREQAARLTNRKLAVTGNELVKLPPDTQYVFDLIGCEVVADDDGRRLGEIADVQRYPANDVYVVRTVNGQEVLFPAVTDFVLEIDVAARKVVVRSGGMFDDTELKKEP